jgi:hypothetical protein
MVSTAGRAAPSGRACTERPPLITPERRLGLHGTATAHHAGAPARSPYFLDRLRRANLKKRRVPTRRCRTFFPKSIRTRPISPRYTRLP